MTGLSQIKGRNAISWEHKFRFDVWYVDHISLSLDVRIFWWTIINAIKPEGIGLVGSDSNNNLIHNPFNGNVK